MSWIQDIFRGQQVREQAQQQTQGKSVPGVPASTAETCGKQSGKQTVAGAEDGSTELKPGTYTVPAQEPKPEGEEGKEGKNK